MQIIRWFVGIHFFCSILNVSSEKRTIPDPLTQATVKRGECPTDFEVGRLGDMRYDVFLMHASKRRDLFGLYKTSISRDNLLLDWYKDRSLVQGSETILNNWNINAYSCLFMDVSDGIIAFKQKVCIKNSKASTVCLKTIFSQDCNIKPLRQSCGRAVFLRENHPYRHLQECKKAVDSFPNRDWSMHYYICNPIANISKKSNSDCIGRIQMIEYFLPDHSDHDPFNIYSCKVIDYIDEFYYPAVYNKTSDTIPSASSTMSVKKRDVITTSSVILIDEPVAFSIMTRVISSKVSVTNKLIIHGATKIHLPQTKTKLIGAESTVTLKSKDMQPSNVIHWSTTGVTGTDITQGLKPTVLYPSKRKIIETVTVLSSNLMKTNEVINTKPLSSSILNTSISHSIDSQNQNCITSTPTESTFNSTVSDDQECTWVCVNRSTLTKESQERFINSLLNEMIDVRKNKSSASRQRSKSSFMENRPASKGIGGVAIASLTLIVVAVFLLGLPLLRRHIKFAFRNIRNHFKQPLRVRPADNADRFAVE